MRASGQLKEDLIVRLEDKESLLTDESIEDIILRVSLCRNCKSHLAKNKHWTFMIAEAFSTYSGHVTSSPRNLRQFIKDTIGFVPIKVGNPLGDEFIALQAIGYDFYKDFIDVPETLIDSSFIKESLQSYYYKPLKECYHKALHSLFKGKTRNILFIYNSRTYYDE